MKVVWTRWLWPVLVAAGCGTSNDDRPATMDYITEGILLPTCGGAQCHAAFGANRGDVFDSVDAARRSIHRNGLATVDDKTDPDHAALITWVTATDPFGLGIGRMPYDAPMPNEDVALFKKWIGAGVPGGQCVPEDNNGKECDGLDVRACDPDGNFGTVQMTCDPTTQLCANGACIMK
jgi:hypothetical protein